MSLSSLEIPKDIETNVEDTLDHYYCADCFPDGGMAFCGTNVQEANELASDIEFVSCVVCTDLDYCPICDDI